MEKIYRKTTRTSRLDKKNNEHEVKYVCVI